MWYSPTVRNTTSMTEFTNFFSRWWLTRTLRNWHYWQWGKSSLTISLRSFHTHCTSLLSIGTSLIQVGIVISTQEIWTGLSCESCLFLHGKKFKVMNSWWNAHNLVNVLSHRMNLHLCGWRPSGLPLWSGKDSLCIIQMCTFQFSSSSAKNSLLTHFLILLHCVEKV